MSKKKLATVCFGSSYDSNLVILRHYATESILYMLASNMDAGVQDYQLEAACAKVFASVSVLVSTPFKF